MKSLLSKAAEKAKEALANSEALQSALDQAKAAATPALENAKTKAAEAFTSLGETLKDQQATLTESTNSLTGKAKELLNKLPDPADIKLPPLPLEVSEAKLNTLAANAITDDSRIKTLNIRCQPDIITVSGSLALVGLPLTFSTRLALESCELNPARKVIVLRRLDNMTLGSDNMLAGFMAHIVKILICGLFGADLGAISLKNIQGLTISKSLITADLEAMGAMAAINNGLRTKISQGVELLPAGPLAKIILKPVLDLAGNALLGKLHLRNVAVAEGSVKGEVVLVSLG